MIKGNENDTGYFLIFQFFIYSQILSWQNYENVCVMPTTTRKDLFVTLIQNPVLAASLILLIFWSSLALAPYVFYVFSGGIEVAISSLHPEAAAISGICFWVGGFVTVILYFIYYKKAHLYPILIFLGFLLNLAMLSIHAVLVLPYYLNLDVDALYTTLTVINYFVLFGAGFLGWWKEDEVSLNWKRSGVKMTPELREFGRRYVAKGNKVSSGKEGVEQLIRASRGGR